MLSSFFNLLREHIDGKNRKRRLTEDGSEVPSKQLKFYFGNKSFLPDSMSEVEKENKNDVEVIGEVRHPKWIAPRTTFRRRGVEGGLEESAVTSTPIATASTSHDSSSFCKRTQRMVSMARGTQQDKDVEVLCSVRHVPIERNGRLAKKNFAEKIFGTFKPSASSITKPKKKLLTCNSLRLLEEKMTYRKLLELHHSHPTSPFTIADIKTKSPLRKKEILVLDLEPELSSLRVSRERESAPSTPSSRAFDQGGLGDGDDIVVLDEVVRSKPLKPITPVNSLRDYIKHHPVFREIDVKQIITDHEMSMAEKRRLASLEEAKLQVLSAHNEKTSSEALEQRLREYMKITEPPVYEVTPEYTLPELTEDQEERVTKSLKPTPAAEVLVEKFGLKISRRDMATLKGLNWLNDEVINFYMELLMQRGRKDSMPKVYAFNTFFYQNMVNGRYNVLRRWTRKVDLFGYDMVFIPVHLGMHWCMAVVDFRTKEIRYYDSMGAKNDTCLDGLLSYLQAESMDKKKQQFDSTGWQKMNVADIPQQMNGSDCGVFACMFAEHLSRDAPLLFTQDNMPYFRRKMVIEILEGALIT